MSSVKIRNCGAAKKDFQGRGLRWGWHEVGWGTGRSVWERALGTEEASEARAAGDQEGDAREAGNGAVRAAGGPGPRGDRVPLGERVRLVFGGNKLIVNIMRLYACYMHEF